MKQIKCENCGAPFKDYKCPYCGSEYVGESKPYRNAPTGLPQLDFYYQRVKVENKNIVIRNDDTWRPFANGDKLIIREFEEIMKGNNK